MIKQLLLLVASCVMLITACGGSDNNTSAPPDKSPAPTSTLGPTPTPGPTAPPTTTKAPFRPITKSTILLTQAPDISTTAISEYRADGLFWGHMPSRQIHMDNVVDGWVAEVDRYRAMGLDYFARGEFDWAWAWFIDFEDDKSDDWVKNLNGDYVRYEFMGDLIYQGIRNYWVSHHSPRFKDFLFFQVDRLMQSDFSYLFFDSQTSATRAVHWFGGDFSDYAISGFRDYLADHYGNTELADMGISNISEFDYRQHLIDLGYTLQTYMDQARTINSGIPLYEDFVFFNREAINKVMDDVFDYIDSKQANIPICATTSLIEPRGFLFSDRLDFICGEYFHQSALRNGTPFHQLTHLKAAEALDKDLIYFPYPGEWVALLNRNTPKQGRTWIAQAYAAGAIFSVPRVVWTGGSNVWTADYDLFNDLYQLIDQKAELFDNYIPYSNVGYVYPVMAMLDDPGLMGTDVMHNGFEYLLEANAAFDLLVFGDKNQPIAPSLNKLNTYDVIFVDSDQVYLSESQQQLLTSSQATIVHYDQRETLADSLTEKIDILSNDETQNELITAFPRVSSNDESAPYVIHLINRVYDPASDDVVTHPNVVVRISPNFFETAITAAEIHYPGGQTETLAISYDTNNNLLLPIGNFGLWGIIELSH